MRWLAACQTTSGYFSSDYIYIDNFSTGVYPSGSTRWIMLKIASDRYVSISKNSLLLTIWRFIPRQTFRTTRHAVVQTPSTGLRHPSFGGRCRKAMLGVWLWWCEFETGVQDTVHNVSTCCVAMRGRYHAWPWLIEELSDEASLSFLDRLFPPRITHQTEDSA